MSGDSMHDLVDLHLHCVRSDGILTPTELVAEAALLGLRAIAFADHDNVDGILEALAAGRKYCVEEIRETVKKRGPEKDAVFVFLWACCALSERIEGLSKD